MLSPNALRVLDSLGVYERIRHQGFNFETLAFVNESNATTNTYYFGSQKLYGYQALRIYRKILIDELLTMLAENNVPIKYEMKFEHVVAESAEGVEFAFKDGSTASASLLIGADGIHSRVRRCLFPDLTPKFSGILAITSAIPRSKLRAPADFPLPVTIMAKPGAFVMAPQDVDGSELLVGTQRVFQDQGRAGWEKLITEQQELLDLIQKDLSAWPDVVRSALESIEVGKLTIWPFYTVPKLDRWTSSDQKVIILGDAAHAIPPTAGQGVNQAFEDAFMLAKLLSVEGVSMSDSLSFWQNYRQARVDKVLELTRQMNAKRLPAAEQAKLAKGEVWEGGSKDGGEELRWLYEPDIEKEVMSWAQGQRTSGLQKET